MNKGKKICGLRWNKIFLSKAQPTHITDFESVKHLFLPSEMYKLIEKNIPKREFRLRQLSHEKEQIEEKFVNLNDSKEVNELVKEPNTPKKLRRKIRSVKRKKKKNNSSRLNKT
mmetsp:Transcript_8306/g.7358  ORF Transcript_8306/g.7358 Transcript_8306/m.7358 type:complete len:114 (+) Transcript_8306:442-783(+)